MSRPRLLPNKKAYLIHLARAGDIQAQAELAENSNRFLSGLRVFAPTTASTQVTGTGATTVRVNTDWGLIAINTITGEYIATTDTVIATASPLLALGQSVVIAVVAKQAANGTLSLIGASAAPATTGSQLSPTDDILQTAVGAGLQFVKLAEVTINRTADTVLTQTVDNTKRDFGFAL